MRIFGVAISVLGLFTGQKDADAAHRPAGVGPDGRTPQRQPRRSGRRSAPPPTFDRRPCPHGRHLAAVQDGAVFLDGRRVSSSHAVHVLVPPTWRADGGALAWIERDAGVTRLQVLPDLYPETRPLSFALPPGVGSDPVHWSSATKVVLGPHVLAPRAVASWSEG